MLEKSGTVKKKKRKQMNSCCCEKTVVFQIRFQKANVQWRKWVTKAAEIKEKSKQEKKLK